MNRTHMQCTTQANIASRVTIIDSSATQHMFKDLSSFWQYSPQELRVTCALNYQSLTSRHVGMVDVEIRMDKQKTKLLHEVLHVPDLHHNFLLVWALTKEGNNIIFKRSGTIEFIRDDSCQELG